MPSSHRPPCVTLDDQAGALSVTISGGVVADTEGNAVETRKRMRREGLPAVKDAGIGVNGKEAKLGDVTANMHARLNWGHRATSW